MQKSFHISLLSNTIYWTFDKYVTIILKMLWFNHSLPGETVSIGKLQKIYLGVGAQLVLHSNPQIYPSNLT